MNRHRVAALLRQLADELERDDVDERDTKPANDTPRRRTPAPTPPLPAREPSEIDKQRAARSLRNLGYRVKP